MSKSKNVRSRYQTVPEHVRDSIAVKVGRGRRRARDERGAERQAMRVLITGIVREMGDHFDLYHDDTDGAA